jgi:tripartite-type tricarboxylate transporter receptor subunit TctC
MQAVLSNTIPLAVVSLPPTLPFLGTGQLIGLGVTGERRWPDLPNLATMVELGFPGFITDTFQALFAPLKTPQPIQDALVAATLKLLANPEVAETLRKGGFEVIAHGPQQFRQRINQELPMWRDLIARSGIEPI